MSGAWMVGPKGGLVRVPTDGRAPPAGCKPLPEPFPTIVDADGARFAVAGTRHHATAEGLAALKLGDVLLLEPLPDPRDPSAVLVSAVLARVHDELVVRRVGWVPRVIAPQVRAACIAAGGGLQAFVERLGEPGDVDRFVYVRAPLTPPVPFGKLPAGSDNPHPPAMPAPHEDPMTTPCTLTLVALTPEELAGLRALPALVAALSAGPAAAAPPAAAGTGPAPVPGPGDLVPHPLNPSAAPIRRDLAAKLVADRDAAVAKANADTAARAAAAADKSIGEHMATPVPTLDDLRAACGRAATRLGGNAAALARMATFGASRVGDVPENRRALFIRYMDGDDAALVRA